MRSEENPLDLNNLPDDYYSKDIGKQAIIEKSSSSGYRKKKNGVKEGKDDGKVYECRFCSLKFCKSQALGGHMNRHRQERETETLNKARQLVFGNNNSSTQQPSHLSGGYHHSTNNMVSDPNPFPLRFPTRMFSASSTSTLIPTPLSQSSIQNPYQPYNLYPSHSLPTSFRSHYPQDYYVGHVLTRATSTTTSSTKNTPNLSYTMGVVPETSSYTFIGAPVVHGYIPPRPRRFDVELERSSGSSRSYAAGEASGTHQRLDIGSSINRYQDGFSGNVFD